MASRAEERFFGHAAYHRVVPENDDLSQPPALDAAAYLERFHWHPEPELIGFRDEAASRKGVRQLGEATWAIAVDYLYEQAARRAMGAAPDYETARAAFYGGCRAVAAPSAPSRSAAVLAEFERRLAASQLNAQHPRNFGYFTPPPLLMSIAGEVLAQVTNQGVDVWHAGPTGAFVEEEVVRWLAELVGYGPDSFGLLTSGGVMANFMAMALARDIHLPRVCGLDRPPRGRDLEGSASTPRTRRTSRSRGRSTSWGFPTTRSS